MKNLVIVCMLTLLVFSCKKEGGNGGVDPIVISLKDKITKNWKVNTVKQGSLEVFLLGSSSNIQPGYSSFRFNLSSSGSVSVKEVNGDQISGKWSLSSDNKTLVLSELIPVPSESQGTIEYTIVEASEKVLNITANKQNFKTGGTINAYFLIPE